MNFTTTEIAAIGALLGSLITAMVSAVVNFRSSKVSVKKDEMAMLRGELTRLYERNIQLDADVTKYSADAKEYEAKTDKLIKEVADLRELITKERTRHQNMRDYLALCVRVIQENELKMPVLRRAGDMSSEELAEELQLSMPLKEIRRDNRNSGEQQ